MGYEARGSIKVRFTDEVATEAALDLDALRRALADRRYSAADFVPGAGEEVIATLLDNCGFEVVEKATSPEDPQIRTYSAWFSGKWREHISIILDFLGSHGAGIESDFIGEDDEMWAISCGLGERNVCEEAIVPVHSRTLRTYQEQKAILDAVRAVIDATPDGVAVNRAALVAALDTGQDGAS